MLKIATHKEKHLILQIMAERSVKLVMISMKGVRRLYETLKSYTESVNDDETLWTASKANI